MNEWRTWAKYRTFRDARRNKAWQELDTERAWRVVRDKTVIRGWLLQHAPQWRDDEPGT